MPSAHALLSPSAAHRWLHCTAAPRLEATFPDISTPYAEEGTLAHALCVLRLKTHGAKTANTEEEEKEIADLKEKYYSGEMDEYVDSYVNIVLQAYAEAKGKTHDAALLIEQRLDFSRRVPESFGTSDAIIVADDTLNIFDFKYGKGVKVSARENPQMMIYALGAYDAFSLEYNIRQITMSIVQPRLANYDTYTISARDLLSWSADTLEPRARQAFAGGDDARQIPGDWCRFCKAKGRCKALASHAIQIARIDTKLLTNQQLGDNILPQLAIIKDWCNAVEQTATEKMLAGEEVPGWKIVEGRSNRKISDAAEVEKALREGGYTEDVYMRPAELKTITELEKAIGKKTFGTLCGNYITKPAGKPTLAPASDKRPAFNSTINDFIDIINNK